LEKLTSAGAHSARQFMEELAILKRWYYRSHKVGAIIFVKDDGQWPMRKLGNAVGRVYRGERISETTKDTKESAEFTTETRRHGEERT